MHAEKLKEYAQRAIDRTPKVHRETLHAYRRHVTARGVKNKTVYKYVLAACVLRVVCESPGASQTKIADRVPGRTRQDVAYHLGRLEKLGVVTSVRVGKQVQYCPSTSRRATPSHGP